MEHLLKEKNDEVLEIQFEFLKNVIQFAIKLQKNEFLAIVYRFNKILYFILFF
jgi:hypothetical protein